ncbi:hypothetical protein JX265_007900 [Neoarthrinium moseri]|uniref:DUF1740-domain-containing protein n=1 Tax=Neoarthrinium moseri TaxID=1658444 RepID=A0A9P9WIW5_9PEZI|nr:hypothetical protein JX265_007900 [Neoarthrinium moseri]
MASKGGSSVPKFSSFKRKTETPPAVEEEKQTAPAATNDEVRRKDKDRSQRRQGISHSDVTQLPERGSRKDGRNTRRQPLVSPHPAQPHQTGNDIFVIDKTGDGLIRRYGSNNRYDIPGYRRIGAGRLLGSNAFLRIDRTSARQEFSLLGFGEGSSALSRHRKSVLANAGRESSDVVRVRADTSGKFTGSEDFLALRQSKKRKRDESLSDHETSGEDKPSYKSIHGMSKKHEHSDSDEAYGSDSSSETGPPDTNDPVKLRGIELSARVKTQPDDMDAWIELVGHQDVLLRATEHGDRRATQAEVRSFADIKLSLLDKALAHAKTPEYTRALRLQVMHEGSKVWDPKTLTQRWENLLKDHGTSFEIWRSYVIFRQTNLSTIRYDDIKRLYTARLRVIEEEIACSSSASDKQALYGQMAVVFLAATQFIADSGFGELAAAAWQATLELNFHRPQSLANVSKDSALSSFQGFWESEVPRIGDDSAQGWANFHDSGGMDEATEPKSFSSGKVPQTRDPYKAWAAIETQRAQDAVTPARTMDDGTEDDPYRVVMYSDIEELLVFIATEALPIVRGQLVDAFLLFNQLPVAFGTSNTILASSKDCLAGGIRNLPITAGNDEKESVGEVGQSTFPQPAFEHRYQAIAKSTEVLFPSQSWFKYLSPIRGIVPAAQFGLVMTTVRQLALSSHQSEFATYCLALECYNNAGGSKKAAKALLKQDAGNIELYVGFAKSEFVKGAKDSARNVASASLGLPSLSSHDRLLLCLTWAWMEIEDGQLKESLRRLCHASQDDPSEDLATPAQVLKMKQMLTGSRDHLLSSRDADTAVTYAKGLALLEYMTRSSGKEPQSGSQGDVWSAMASIESCSAELISRGFRESPAHEKLLQFAAELLFYHANHGPYRPAFLREHIERYITLFPQNTIFLNLYAWREERLSIDDRVRSLLDLVVLTKAHDCVSSRVFAIRHEMGTGNVHSTRAAFERAVESETCKHHVGVWISYIRYCHQKKELRSKAKDVFYRAIQECPWSKHVFMEAFVTLARDMDSSELKSVYNTLCEKGLRVHVELDEFVRSWKQDQKRRA